MSLKTLLKSLKKEKDRLSQKEKILKAQERARQQLAGRLEAMVKSAGLPPRDLVFALVDHFHVRLAGRRKGQRGRRKRTKITVELRDAVKKMVKNGVSMNRASKEFNLSYAVVIKMLRGHYDGLS